VATADLPPAFLHAESPARSRAIPLLREAPRVLGFDSSRAPRPSHIAHCAPSPDPARADEAPTADELVWDNAPFQWARITPEAFEASLPVAERGRTLPSDHALTVRAQAWADRFHALVSKRVLAQTGTPPAAPRARRENGEIIAGHTLDDAEHAELLSDIAGGDAVVTGYTPQELTFIVGTPQPLPRRALHQGPLPDAR